VLDEEVFSVTVKGDGMSVSRTVSKDIAAAIISMAMTGRQPNADVVASSPKGAATQGATDSALPKLSLREFLDSTGAATNSEKIVAIGCYLAAHEVQTTFSKDDVRGRFRLAGEPAPGNLHRDFAAAVKSGWISEDPQAPGQFYVTQKGYKAMQAQPADNAEVTSAYGSPEHVSGVDGEAKVKRKRGTAAVKTANWIIVEDLLDEKGRMALKEFFVLKRPDSQNDQVAVLTYKLKELTGRPGFNGNEIYTALQIVGARTPGNLMAVLGNMATAGLGRVIERAFHPNFKTDDLVKLDLPKKVSSK
jgi:hypothetical protein